MEVAPQRTQSQKRLGRTGLDPTKLVLQAHFAGIIKKTHADETFETSKSVS